MALHDSHLTLFSDTGDGVTSRNRNWTRAENVAHVKLRRKEHMANHHWQIEPNRPANSIAPTENWQKTVMPAQHAQFGQTQ